MTWDLNKLLCKSWTYIKIKIGITCKKSVWNLKSWVRFWDLKIWQHWDFASAPVTKIHVTRSMFEIEGSSFGFSLIFVCSKNHILQLKVSDRFFNDLIFYIPLPKGGRIKNLNSNLVQIFCFKYLGKVKKLWFNICMRLKANPQKRLGGVPQGRPGPNRVKTRVLYWLKHVNLAKIFFS